MDSYDAYLLVTLRKFIEWCSGQKATVWNRSFSGGTEEIVGVEPTFERFVTFLEAEQKNWVTNPATANRIAAQTLNDHKDDPKPSVSFNHKVSLTCNGPTSNKAALVINDQMVPFYEATAVLKAGEFVTITARIAADSVDIEALEKNTKVTIEGDRP